MIYQQRDLAVVAIAALGAGYLVGTETIPTAPAPPTEGITVVQRLIVPQKRPPDPWPMLLQVRQADDNAAFEPIPRRLENGDSAEGRSIASDRDPGSPAAPPPPHDACSPGHRENFVYRGVQHWRCRYSR